MVEFLSILPNLSTPVKHAGGRTCVFTGGDVKSAQAAIGIERRTRVRAGIIEKVRPLSQQLLLGGTRLQGSAYSASE